MNAHARDFAMITGASDVPFVINSQGQIDVNQMRPFFGVEGEPIFAVNSQGDTALATNALLQYQEWLDIDRTVLETLNQRLVGIADIRGRNLTHNLGSIGQTISMWQTVSDMEEANISMDGVTSGTEDTPEFGIAQVPVPIIHKDWRLNMRRLQASRMFGESLDVTAAAIAGRLVAEASERMLFSGAPIRVEGSTIYGYRNYPLRGQVTLGTPWPNASPSQIKADVQAMLELARSRRFYGQFTLYIPGEWEGVLDEFFVISGGDDAQGFSIATPGRTIRDVLLSLSGLERIVVADFMGGADEAVMVSLQRETVDLAIAQEPTTISWQAMGGMQERFKTMAVWVPRLKSDHEGRCGIVHLRQD